MTKVVFLDRDGVINALVTRDGKSVSPRTYSDFRVLPGVVQAVALLRQAGFNVVVVTNQPDLSRGHMLSSELERMHDEVMKIGVHAVFVCPHSDEDCCSCRKPKVGLLRNYLATLDEEPSELWMIGDSEVDIQAGRSVNARTVRIIESAPVEEVSSSDFIAGSLLDSLRLVL